MTAQFDRPISATDPPAWHTLRVEQVLALQGSAPEGLSSVEARRRLARTGPNELLERARRGAWHIVLTQFRSVTVLVLLVAAALAFLTGSLKEAIAILAIVVLNALLGFVQEHRAERSIEALRGSVKMRARVRRAGQLQDLDASDLVPGDVVLLEAGTHVPADGRVLEAASLGVQEAALTGESGAVSKSVPALDDPQAPVADRDSMLYMGTVVTAGRGVFVVTATGMSTELGRIADLIQGVQTEQTPLQRRLDQMGKSLAWLALAAATLVFLAGLWRGEAVQGLLLNAISVAVAAIPEGLSTVVTIALALGAQRMLKRRALIRSLPAVETLGSVTVICSDKTGTLTQNRMAVTLLDGAGGRRPLGEADPQNNETERLLLLIGALCNDAELAASETDGVGDPTELALVVAAQRFYGSKADLEAALPRTAEEPFDPVVKRMSTTHRVQDPALLPAALAGAADLKFYKGSPDVLLGLSRQVWNGDQPEQISGGWRARVEGAIADLAKEGMRVLGAAYERPGSGQMVFVGLFGMTDPPRPEVRGAVATARRAGIRTVMITGDHPLTALSIARQLGLIDPHDTQARAVSGPELGGQDQAALDQTVQEVNVYARVSPEHKLRIIGALQRQGQIVAMTGDGVNDAPALRKADIGVAMGITGTDVTRQAADMVLLDDNFATIVGATEEGRGIYDNLRKFIRFSLAGNVGKVLVVLLAPFLGLVSPLMPLQMLWLNLLTDGLLGLGMSVEPPERGVMSRPPVDPRESLFARGLSAQIIWTGLLVTALTLGIGLFYFLEGRSNWRTVLFTALAFAQVGQALSARTNAPLRAGASEQGRGNPILWGLALTVVALQLLVLYVPPLAHLFKVTPLPLPDLLVAGGAGIVVFLVSELSKWGGIPLTAARRPQKQ